MDGSHEGVQPHSAEMSIFLMEEIYQTNHKIKLLVKKLQLMD